MVHLQGDWDISFSRNRYHNFNTHLESFRGKEIIGGLKNSFKEQRF